MGFEYEGVGDFDVVRDDVICMVKECDIVMGLMDREIVMVVVVVEVPDIELDRDSLGPVEVESDRLWGWYDTDVLWDSVEVTVIEAMFEGVGDVVGVVDTLESSTDDDAVSDTVCIIVIVAMENDAERSRVREAVSDCTSVSVFADTDLELLLICEGDRERLNDGDGRETEADGLRESDEMSDSESCDRDAVKVLVRLLVCDGDGVADLENDVAGDEDSPETVVDHVSDRTPSPTCLRLTVRVDEASGV